MMATASNNPIYSNHPSKPFDPDGPQKYPPAEPSFEFDGLIWTKMTTESNHISNIQQYPEDLTTALNLPTIQWEATQQTKTPVWAPQLLQVAPSAMMDSKSTAKEWQTKTPDSAPQLLQVAPSALMDSKTTPKWQTKTPALALRLLQVAPSALMDGKFTTKWKTIDASLGAATTPGRAISFDR